MTKKDLISKLDELGGRFGDLQSYMSDVQSYANSAFDELKEIKNIIDNLPEDVNEIENDEE